MAYTELIKNFSRIRDYMRDFYVYGFKSRTEYDRKSARSYDNERRRMESWLGDYMTFRQTAAGKNVFLTIDSRSTRHNPFHKALKSKSFTDGDITLHFILFDILHDEHTALTLSEIAERIDADYLSRFANPMSFDESTLRKKLKEYVQLGLLTAEKEGRTVRYRRRPDIDISRWRDAISFFTEAGLAGAVGSFLLDKQGGFDFFTFKHHYINHTLEIEVLCTLLDAMSQQRAVTLVNYSRRFEGAREWEVVPLRIFVSVQTGRRYLLAWHLRFHKTVSYRLDYVASVKLGAPFPYFAEHREALAKKQAHMWGVVCDDRVNPKYHHVEFTVHIGDGEEHIWNRLEREKRCGTVTRIDAHTAKFSADVYDTSEMLPWIRTFLCRITSLEMTDTESKEKFLTDIRKLADIYGVGGDEA